MAIRKVAQMGNPVLRQVATPFTPEEIRSEDTRRLVADMLQTVEEYEGAGLAAPQVHVSRRLVVLQLYDSEPFRVWFNPEITPLTEDQLATYEGCLSVDGIRAAVARCAHVRVRVLNEQGEPEEFELEGFAAIVSQHECDHLDGVLFIDRCDPRTLTFIPEYRRYGAWALCDEEE